MKIDVDLLKSEGVLLALVPLVGTVLALAYEAGVLSFYDAPRTLIQLDFVRIILATGVTVVCGTIFSSWAVLLMALLRGNHPLIRVMYLPAIFCIIFSLLQFLSPEGLGSWWIPVSIFVVPTVALLVMPLFYLGSKDSYLVKLKSQQDSMDLSFRKTSVENARTSDIFDKVFPKLFTIFIAVILVSSLGRKMAEIEVSHWILKDSNTWILAANYGDLYILKEMDLTTKQIGPSLKIVKVGSSTDLNFQRLRLGALKPAVGATGKK